MSAKEQHIEDLLVEAAALKIALEYVKANGVLPHTLNTPTTDATLTVLARTAPLTLNTLVSEILKRYQVVASEHFQHDEDLLEQLYWEFDAKRKATGDERLAFKAFVRAYAVERFKHLPVVSASMEADAEEAQCVRECLDTRGVPSSGRSLWGRVQYYVDNHSEYDKE